MDRVLQSLGLIRAIDTKAGTVEAVISTGNLARDDAMIETRGWQLGEFRSNPVVLWSHDGHSPPIGKAIRVAKDKTDLAATLRFDLEDERSLALFAKIDRGFIHATSVRWIPIETEFRDNPDEKEGGKVLVFKRQTLLEISFVSVPADPGALIKRGFDAESVDAFLRDANVGMSDADDRAMLIGCADGDTECEMAYPRSLDIQDFNIAAAGKDEAEMHANQMRAAGFRVGALDDPAPPDRGILDIETGQWSALDDDADNDDITRQIKDANVAAEPIQIRITREDAPDPDPEIAGELTDKSSDEEHLQRHAEIAVYLQRLTHLLRALPSEEAINLHIDVALDYAARAHPNPESTVDRAFPHHRERTARANGSSESFTVVDRVAVDSALSALADAADSNEAQRDAWCERLRVLIDAADTERLSTDPLDLIAAAGTLSQDAPDGMLPSEIITAQTLARALAWTTLPGAARSEFETHLREHLAEPIETPTPKPADADGVITPDAAAVHDEAKLTRLEKRVARKGSAPRLDAAAKAEVNTLAVAVSALLRDAPVDELSEVIGEMTPSSRSDLTRVVTGMTQRKDSGKSGEFDLILIAAMAQATGRSDKEVAALLEER